MYTEAERKLFEEHFANSNIDFTLRNTHPPLYASLITHSMMIGWKAKGESSKELAAAQAENASRKYFMIEKIIDGTAHWWIPDHSQTTHWDDPCRWTTDSSKARHYDSKLKAEYVRGYEMLGCYVTSHIDCAGPAGADTIIDESIRARNG